MSGDWHTFEIVPRTIRSSPPLGDMCHAEASSTCWHRLFHGTVLAYGFPISPRAAGKGVEIPFDLMVSLATVKTSLQRDSGGTILIGHLLMLYVSGDLGGGEVQWHCAQVEEKDSARFLSGDVISLNDDFDRLSKSRTFLGYDDAEVVLANQDLLESNTVEPSDLGERNEEYRDCPRGYVSLGLTIKSNLREM